MYLVQHFYKEEMPNFLQLWVKKSYKITKKKSFEYVHWDTKIY